uniref:Uncharacterized protein n=1 Tax=Solanum lycopersicum TaxID=4081 RepID=A0A3Q7I2M6_SOLLC
MTTLPEYYLLEVDSGTMMNYIYDLNTYCLNVSTFKSFYFILFGTDAPLLKQYFFVYGRQG